MATPAPMPRPPRGFKALFLTTTGVLALTAMALAGGGAFLLYTQFGPATVTVIEVTAGIAVNATDLEVGTLRVDPIHLPHCADAWLESSPRQLTVAGGPFDHAIEVVVLVRYPGGPSFSSGGDDTRVFFLRHGERAEIAAALNSSSVLYRIAPGASTPIQPVMGNLTGARAVSARYVVNGTLNMWPSSDGASGNFAVDEIHELAQWDAVPVISRGPVGCM